MGSGAGLKTSFFAGIGGIDLATTQRYIHRLKKENREALAALPGLTDFGKVDQETFPNIYCQPSS
jgi:hypothetical protein